LGKPRALCGHDGRVGKVTASYFYDPYGTPEGTLPTDYALPKSHVTKSLLYVSLPVKGHFFNTIKDAYEVRQQSRVRVDASL
jgi:hypothetical protein